jgi:hypothetical protein
LANNRSITLKAFLKYSHELSNPAACAVLLEVIRPLLPPALDLADEKMLPGGDLFRVRQVGEAVQGDFGPGAGGVAAGGAELAECPGRELAGIFTDAVVAENDDEAVVVDSPDKAPGDFDDPEEKLGQDYQDIGVRHPADIAVDPFLAPLPDIEAFLKIAEHLQGELGHLDTAHQGMTGIAEEIVKGPNVGFGGGSFEVVGIGFNGVKQGRGQFQGRRDSGQPQVFRQNGRVGAVLRPDIHKTGLALGAQGMVVDDDVIINITKKGVMAGLGVNQGKAVKIGLVDLLKGREGDLQEFDHSLVLGPGYWPDGRYGAGSQAPPQESLQGHGTGNGVGVSINEDEQTILMIEELP